MSNVATFIQEIQGHMNDINVVTAAIESKGKMQYNHSKQIRNSAMEIVKSAKNLRMATLSEFKAQKGE